MMRTGVHILLPYECLKYSGPASATPMPGLFFGTHSAAVGSRTVSRSGRSRARALQSSGRNDYNYVLLSCPAGNLVTERGN